MYWPGSEAPIGGSMPTYWEAYDDKNRTSFEHRVDSVLSWLDLPAGQRPTFLSLYFENVDSAAAMNRRAKR